MPDFSVIGSIEHDNGLSEQPRFELAGIERRLPDEQIVNPPEILVPADPKPYPPASSRDKRRPPQPLGNAAIEDSVGQYLREAKLHALLTKEDEVRLGRTIQAGGRAAFGLALSGLLRNMGHQGLSDNKVQGWITAVQDGEEAKRQFAQANLFLVVSVANRYKVPGMDRIDIIQEGNLGLMRAIEKFDPDKGFKFSTYATWWIRQAIGRGIKDRANTIRLPAHVIQEIKQVRMTEAQLQEVMGRKPTLEEVAAELGIPPSKVEKSQKDEQLAWTVSLDAPPGEFGEAGETREAGLIDFIGVDDDMSIVDQRLDHAHTAETVERMLDVLNDQERQVIILKFGLYNEEPRERVEIGRMLERSAERIRQIEDMAKRKMRAHLGLPTYRASAPKASKHKA